MTFVPIQLPKGVKPDASDDSVWGLDDEDEQWFLDYMREQSKQKAEPEFYPPMESDEGVEAFDLALETYVDELVEEVFGTTYEGVRDLIMEGYAQEWTDETWGNVLDGLSRLFGSDRAKTIAVTETTRLFGAGAIAMYEDLGLETWQWQTVEDPWVSDRCQELNDKVFPITEPFKPLHPNCRCFPRATSIELQHKVMLKHLPGQHDQKSHGGSKGSADSGGTLTPEQISKLSGVGGWDTDDPDMDDALTKLEGVLTGANGQLAQPARKSDLPQYPGHTDTIGWDTSKRLPNGEIQEALKPDFADWAESLADHERFAVVNYTDASDTLNTTLTKGSPKQRQDMIDSDHVRALDDALDQASLPYNMILYRGLGKTTAAQLRQSWYGTAEGGINFRSHAYTSTSANPYEAINWGIEDYSGNKYNVMRIKAPKGSKAAAVNAIGDVFRTEAEVLIKRDTVYKVTKVSTETVGTGDKHWATGDPITYEVTYFDAELVS